MNSLLKTAIFCLFFISLSEVGFGQSNTTKVLPTDKYVVIEEIKTDISYKKVERNERTGEIYTYQEVMPQFPGGIPKLLEFMNANLQFPEVKLKKNTLTTVYVQFDILVNGEVANAYVKKGVHPLFDQEALRLINLLPRWRPGMQNGKPVVVKYNFPVRFNQ